MRVRLTKIWTEFSFFVKRHGPISAPHSLTSSSSSSSIVVRYALYAQPSIRNGTASFSLHSSCEMGKKWERSARCCDRKGQIEPIYYQEPIFFFFSYSFVWLVGRACSGLYRGNIYRMRAEEKAENSAGGQLTLENLRARARASHQSS